MDSTRKFRATVVRDGRISEGKIVDYNGSEVSVKL